MAEPLASVNDEQLLRRSGTSKDDFLLFKPVRNSASLLNVVIIESFICSVDTSECVTVNYNSFALLKGLIVCEWSAICVRLILENPIKFVTRLLDDVNFVCDGCGRGRLITSNHDDLDTCRTALVDGDIDLRSGRIVE